MDEGRRPDDEKGEAEETAELLREYERQIMALPVQEHVERMLTTLSGLALQRLGIGEKEPAACSPQEARLAIDAFRALTEVLAQDEPERGGVYRATLAQMQLAFVSVAGGRAAGKGGAGATPETNGEDDGEAGKNGEGL
ncbi:MAG: hypothetical protein GXX83_03910 [Gaiellales bacterium]|nr:hypothetical protein [Gaiellales bacterium]